MTIRTTLMIAMCSVLSACGKREVVVVPQDGQVPGSVFIVTKGSGSYKFGLVSIYVLQPEKLKRYLDESEIKLKNEINHLKSDHDGLVGSWEVNRDRSQEIRDKIKSLIDGYMNEAVERILISEQPVTKTDADGVFTLERVLKVAVMSADGAT